MDNVYLQDEAVRDRIRAATEFLDPSTCCDVASGQDWLTRTQMIVAREGVYASSGDLCGALTSL